MTIRNFISVLLVAFIFIISGGQITGAESTSIDKSSPVVSCDNNPKIVSIIDLIANPDKFDGKCVTVIGFAHFEFEGDAIYLHEDDFKNGISKNGLWLSVSEDRFAKETRELNNKYVLVQGIFNAKHQGHFNVFSGAIDNITRLEKWNVYRPPYVDTGESWFDKIFKL